MTLERVMHFMMIGQYAFEVTFEFAFRTFDRHLNNAPFVVKRELISGFRGEIAVFAFERFGIRVQSLKVPFDGRLEARGVRALIAFEGLVNTLVR